MFVIGQHLAEMKRILTTEGPACSRNRVDTQEMVRRLETQLRLIEQAMEREARERCLSTGSTASAKR